LGIHLQNKSRDGEGKCFATPNAADCNKNKCLQFNSIKQSELKAFKLAGLTGAGVAQSLQCLHHKLDNHRPVPDWGMDEIFFLCHHIPTRSKAHPAFYAMGTRSIK
jgi:hypothetical protein